ncbi:MAG TPA: hypothetical protein VHN37_09015, partial [Actinomycetota bacterium]|nr:hypothetical protein [Actinomycetota bacterium]
EVGLGDGGWIDLDAAKAAAFNAFPLELARVGFGSEAGGRRWIGFNGGLKLAKPLPLASTVEGLRISWDPAAADVAKSVSVTLNGVGVALTMPGAFHLEGKVAFFDDKGDKGFKGHVDLDLLSLQISVEADLVIAKKGTVTYFYVYLSMDLPSGIPLPFAGSAIYGFKGLVASNLTPKRNPDDDWYHGWYKRAPVGATSFEKWRPEKGAWAVGIGARVGSAPDSAFMLSVNALLVVAGPGPVVLMVGTGDIAKKTSNDPTQEGAFDALLVVDVPAKRFQANLGATYKVDGLLDLRGSAEFAFSWARPQPADLWHLYAGEKSPESRRWQASLLGVFTANAWFQVWRDRANLGGWVGFAEDWKFGPLSAWVNASIEGEANVNFDPPQFDGTLRLIGEGGAEVFGYGFDIAAWATVEAKGPSPKFVGFAIAFKVSVDLWLIEFSYEGDLSLSWGNRTPPPAAVDPVLERVAVEHMKVDEGRDLLAAGQAGGGAVPPDVRPVLVFRRPVRDLPALGLPGTAAWPAPDEVPPAKFSYRLAHVALWRDGTVIATAGRASVQGSSLTISGEPSIPGPVGSIVELDDQPGTRYEVTASAPGSLTVAGSPPAGVHTYRLTSKPVQLGLSISGATRGDFGTVVVTLAVAPGVSSGALAGGVLTAPGGAWAIAGNSGNTITLRGPDLPPTGPAIATAPLVAPLSGAWLPVSDEVPPGQTTLMLGAKTPFAWFRHNAPATLPAFSVNGPAYGCGPSPRENLVCETFASLMPGPLRGRFRTGSLAGAASGDVSVVTRSSPSSRRVLHMRSRPNAPATIALFFDPPANRVVLHFAETRGVELAFRNFERREREEVGNAEKVVKLTGEISRVTVHGSLATLEKVCSSPEWRCTAFEPGTVRAGATGRQSVAGVAFEPQGVMSVEGHDLVVRPRGAAAPADERPGKALAESARCTIHLPRRVSRARITLAVTRVVRAYAGAKQVGDFTATAGEEVEIAPRGWLDRIVVFGAPDLRIRRVCYTTGEPGWSEDELDSWQRSVTQSVEALYRRDPVLAPGSYRLEVISGVDDEADAASPSWDTHSYAMEVGMPPGLAGKVGEAYPAGGPLSDLALYVARTVPVSGGRPHYTAYDAALDFNVSYASQMFLLSKAPMTLSVRDSNGTDLRRSGVNLWGHDPELGLSPVEEEWMKALHGDGSDACVAIDPAKIPRAERVVAAGPLLAPSQLHTASLEALGTKLFSFDFVSSQFASFLEHVGTFDGRCRKVVTQNPGTSHVAAAKSAIAAAASALAAAVATWGTRRQAALEPGAARGVIDGFAQARKDVAAARAALAVARSESYSQIVASYGTPVPGESPLPDHVEVTRLPNALLVTGPEPMHF